MKQVLFVYALLLWSAVPLLFAAGESRWAGALIVVGLLAPLMGVATWMLTATIEIMCREKPDEVPAGEPARSDDESSGR